MYSNPPYTNGVMENPPCTKADLQGIIDGFVPTEDEQTANTFYVVSVWNQQNPETPINGDTAEFVLSQ